LNSDRDLWLADGAGNRRGAFFPGDAMFVSGHGLPVSAPIEFSLAGGKRPVILARYSSDRHGLLVEGTLPRAFRHRSVSPLPKDC
jgi:hypothetical protein